MITWFRKFLACPTTPWLFGIIVPLLMLMLDPMVFRAGMSLVQPEFAAYRAFSYVSIGLAIVVIGVWHGFGIAHAFASGALTAAAVFAAALGIAILPLAVMGTLFMGIGLLGLSPFLTSAVYVHCAIAAMRRAIETSSWSAWRAAAAFTLFFAIPTVTQINGNAAVRSGVEAIVHGDSAESARATRQLRRWSLLMDMQPLLNAYIATTDRAGMLRIGAAYEAITGDDADVAANRLMD